MDDFAKIRELSNKIIDGRAGPQDRFELGELLDKLNIEPNDQIFLVPCPKCGRPLIRSIFWTIACFKSGDNRGCGWKPS